MANDLNNGAERLLQRIMDDAASAAADTAKAAQAEIERIKELAGKDAAAAAEECAAATEKAKADILERSRTNAELDSRKYALQKKRELVEDVFALAFKGLCALDGKERDELLCSTASREALGAEKIIPAAADAQNINRLLEGINGALKEKGVAPLTLGEATEEIGGGFLLKGEGYEKNCSFEAMLRDVRETEESQVAQILFG